MTGWEDTLCDLIVRASTDLPADVEDALRQAAEVEERGSNGGAALQMMLENVELARRSRRPLCQDTGTLLFWVDAPESLSQLPFRAVAESAIVRATQAGMLRENCVDSLTGLNSGTNLGRGSPVVHWREREGDGVKVSLVLKGGGCENVGAQYSLPDSDLGAGRDLEGVRRCLLDAVQRAQGRGCAPGVLGVAIGGDRATGYEVSKRQFLRHIGQRSEFPEVADLERRILTEANGLGIGPMGFGGRTTLLDAFIEPIHRLPASFFVSVSYMCWSYRRQAVLAAIDGTHPEWL